MTAYLHHLAAMSSLISDESLVMTTCQNAKWKTMETEILAQYNKKRVWHKINIIENTYIICTSHMSPNDSAIIHWLVETNDHVVFHVNSPSAQKEDAFTVELIPSLRGPGVTGCENRDSGNYFPNQEEHVTWTSTALSASLLFCSSLLWAVCSALPTVSSDPTGDRVFVSPPTSAQYNTF